MVDPSKVEVSPDGQWVYDGYQWWPIAQVPPGTQTAQGYVWDSQRWHPPQQPEPQLAQPATVVNNTTVKRTGCIGGLLGLVGLVVIVLIFASMFSGGSDTASQPSGESAPSRPEPSYTYSQPEPSDTEPAPSETRSQMMSSADAILAALNLTWEAKSEADQQAMCQAYKVDPGGAYAQFQSGAAQERTQGISRDDFDAFFSFKC